LRNFTFAWLAISSVVMCEIEPVPAVPELTPPGFSPAAASRSAKVLNRASLRTHRTNG
jgi:hypothetical protein